MKQITAKKGENSSRPKVPHDMSTIGTGNTKKPVLGAGFTRITGPGAGFKKVGKVTSGTVGRQDSKKSEEDLTKSKEAGKESGRGLDTNAGAMITAETVSREVKTSDSRREVEGAAGRSDRESNTENQEERKDDDDVAMGGCEGNDAEAITWEEYDPTKPTDCEHANCPGCCATATEYDEQGWVVLPNYKGEAMET